MHKRIFILFIFIFSYQFLNANTYISNDEQFIKGYIYSKLEDRFPGIEIQFDIKGPQIIVYAFPREQKLNEELKFYLENLSNNYEVVFNPYYQPCCDYQVAIVSSGGDWLPELNPFFPTMLAQPHMIGYSAGYRSYDKIFKIGSLPVSIGDQFSLYQFKSLSYGHLYVGIEACVWAFFEAKAKSLSLINADYFIAVPLTYINNRFSSRLRIYHQSSHLGDEFLLENRKIKRLNPSMEVIDLSLAYQFTPEFMAFLGFSRVIRSDDSYKIKPNGIYYGFNYFLDFCKIKICNLEATPYIATYFNNLQDNDWKIDSTVAIGYQWDKLYGHKFRIFLIAHEGFSPDGQFSKQRTRYIAFKIVYGY